MENVKANKIQAPGSNITRALMPLNKTQMKIWRMFLYVLQKTMMDKWNLLLNWLPHWPLQRLKWKREHGQIHLCSWVKTWSARKDWMMTSFSHHIGESRNRQNITRCQIFVIVNYSIFDYIDNLTPSIVLPIYSPYLEYLKIMTKLFGHNFLGNHWIRNLLTPISSYP